MVSWSGLSSDGDNSWHEFRASLILRRVEDGQISVDHVEDVHELSLVLMDSLDLYIVKSIEWHVEASVLLDPSLESCLVLSLDLNEAVLERLVSGVWGKLLEVLQRGDPLIDASKSVTDQLRQSRVAAVDPSSGSDTVRLVLELSFVELIELLENGGLEELRVQGSDTVDGVGADDGEVRHSDLLWPSFFDQTHSHDLLVIARVSLPQFLEIQVVDVVDQFQVSGQQAANQVNGPLLKSLRQDGVVRVGEGVVADIPGLLE